MVVKRTMVWWIITEIPITLLVIQAAWGVTDQWLISQVVVAGAETVAMVVVIQKVWQKKVMVTMDATIELIIPTPSARM